MDSRIRGNDGSCINHSHVDGIIPACAGMMVEGVPVGAVRIVIPDFAGMMEDTLDVTSRHARESGNPSAWKLP